MNMERTVDPVGWIQALGVGVLTGLLVLLVGGVLLYRARAAGRAREARARIEASRASLDAALMRRALAAHEYASMGCLDSSSAVVVLRTVGDVLECCDAAGDDDEMMGPERLEAEEQLTEALRRAFRERAAGVAAGDGCVPRSSPQALAAKEALALASERVHAQRLRHNEVVRRTRHLVSGGTLRLLGLERGARPEALEVEDDVPHLRPGGGAGDVD